MKGVALAEAEAVAEVAPPAAAEGSPALEMVGPNRRKVRPPFKRGWGKRRMQTDSLKLALEREGIRKRLLRIVKRLMQAKDAKEIHFADLKIAYGLLLADEAAELDRKRLEGTQKPAMTVLEIAREMERAMNHALGKEYFE